MAYEYFKNKIMNRMWELLLGYSIWEIWKAQNLRFFEKKSRWVEEMWGLIECHLKEIIKLTQWSQEDFISKANKRLILYELGIYELPVNDAYPRSSPNPISSVNFWKRKPEFSFKLNFDGATKGNPGLVGFGRAIRNFDGIILSIL